MVERFTAESPGRNTVAANPPIEARVKVIQPPHASAMSQAMAKPSPLPEMVSSTALITGRKPAVVD